MDYIFYNHANNNLGVGYLALTKVGEVLGDVMSHLRSRRWGAILVLNHAVVQLRRHGNDHVIVVRVEVAAFGYIKTEGGIVVVTSQQIV